MAMSKKKAQLSVYLDPDVMQALSAYAARREQSMRRKLRKTMALLQAALIGTLAAAAIAGIALLISHS